jgi:hypothetical protein
MIREHKHENANKQTIFTKLDMQSIVCNSESVKRLQVVYVLPQTNFYNNIMYVDILFVCLLFLEEKKKEMSFWVSYYVRQTFKQPWLL